MTADFDTLTTTKSGECFAMRQRLPALAAASLQMSGVQALVRALAGRTTCITMLAGSGSRWVASLEEARAAGVDTGANLAAPRSLFGVANLMGFGPDPMPIAGYALAAVRELGRHVIVVRGWEQEIKDRILTPLSYPTGSWVFATQDAPGGKPRGHGDAAFQTMPLWSGSEYVLVNFGGDASSPLTALSSLAVMEALSQGSAGGSDMPDLIMPAALVDNPAYPITIDERGLPRHFGHAKLQGASGVASGVAAWNGYTNVGVRVYRASALRDAIERIRNTWWTKDHGYHIPGNAPASDDPTGGEFALDNVDAMLAVDGRARLLNVAKPQELSPVKSLADLKRFRRDIAVVCKDWKTLGSLS
jgi:hypothetical protein